MKKVLSLFVMVLLASLCVFSLSSAQVIWENISTPQLEWITNAIPGLWNHSKEDVLRIMSIFPDFQCADYTDQIGCVSKYNMENANIYLNFFHDDYEEHHDNLWKVSVSVDIRTNEQQQTLLRLCWLDGMVPFHLEDREEFTFPRVAPLFFETPTTTMIAYFQPIDNSDGHFFLAEYIPDYMK